ncbi:FHF complex subunit HOOK-interacting protein 1A [Paramormyrops kingsleyae]|uniref:FHF complex subunit HOOK interacting protein 1A n=1 Tax=Paramormyrops kingsleyae TaxID=1676925 RepID=A0A3B3TAF4_9TELE|nr:protein FAM160A1 isoform X1 [Paramormyrops kingsleyae]XP_023654859.1 protein FAM160A1 isoform X1 [Paramormyrops kingsleyae]XP_023654860.1 protein FAM160A1 isoform X1 [Paramormyrops kingsleyae]XP_023654861.1 protein FAM160A1 isoform X1 [Paramormyrops kingsleyae]XP_023654862.1 protein FAM160A1 isoform X1 [Paramormyrops kingsleyae]
MASTVASGNQDGPPVLKGVDPETCMIVFKNHWAQVVKILEKHDPLRGGPLGGASGPRFGAIPGDEASAVQNYVEHMLFLLMEEGGGPGGAMGPILEFVVMENVMERLFVWSLRREFTDDMKLEQLRMYEMLLGRARQPLLLHKPVLRPLMMLLSACSGPGAATAAVESELVVLLSQLCSILAREPSILELFFHTSEDQGAANFLIFSLLIPFIHREGAVGQQARDALLFIMALSAENHVVANYIAENTYFCPVLATGLSGLYSSLPPKLEVRGEDWHCLQREDWMQVPALVQFLNSLEFCNAVIQVANPAIRDQLVSYIYNGFLVPVLAPALHKLTLEEVMTTTAYLDLFLRSVSEPALLQTFLSFILLHRHESVHVLDTLVSRINTPFQLGTVSLALFRTLIGLYCEDVMLQLILRYLIPCSHMMLSQRCVIKERDCYSVSAAKFLALTPSCCPSGFTTPPLRQQLDCILWSKDSQTESIDDSAYITVISAEVPMDISYLHYLLDARSRITRCVKACQVWSAPYDGEDPPPDQYQPSVLDDDGKPRRSSHTRAPRHASELSSAGDRSIQLDLEWDDSYDTALSPTDSPEPLPPVPVEPPKHIQEMRRSAIMLIKGSYVEESDFQDDVMVYNLVAQKDAQDVMEVGVTKPEGPDPSPPGNGPSLRQPALSNGLTSPQESDPGTLLAKPEAGRGRASRKNSLTGLGQDGAEEDLMSQYEELIQALGVEPGSPRKGEQEVQSPLSLMEEEEVDFSSFSPDTPEQDKTPSPLASKDRSRSRTQGVPFTGPFVSVLLSRLEHMLDNSLHINLLLTGILAQLAAYPQPLLRSFLLNTNMVFQPSVRSLYQVLASVKNQIERLASTTKNFPNLLKEGQQCLLARENVLRGRELLGDNKENGFGLHDRGTNRLSSPHLKAPAQGTNAAFATLLFTEFLKELAAVAQEHAVASLIPEEE